MKNVKSLIYYLSDFFVSIACIYNYNNNEDEKSLL